MHRRAPCIRGNFFPSCIGQYMERYCQYIDCMKEVSEAGAASRVAQTMNELTHFDDRGASRMVDTSAKPETLREARASALVRVAPATLALIRDRTISKKGDVLEVARLAGIMAA